MSRLDKYNIWEYHNGDQVEVICPSCGVNRIRINGKNWQCGHIIHHQWKGADSYENIRPICKECNVADKKYESNYHYMVSLGRMTMSEANENCRLLRELAKHEIDHPNDDVCGAPLKTKAGYCKNKKRPRSRYCAIHQQDEEKELKAIFVSTVKRCIEDYEVAKLTNDVEMIEVIRNTLRELKSFKAYPVRS